MPHTGYCSWRVWGAGEVLVGVTVGWVGEMGSKSSRNCRPELASQRVGHMSVSPALLDTGIRCHAPHGAGGTKSRQNLGFGRPTRPKHRTTPHLYFAPIFSPLF